jgi:hypothetical protein
MVSSRAGLTLFLFPLIFLVEAFNTPCGIYDLLLTGKEGVAFIAKLNPEVLPGGTCCEGVTAGANNLGIGKIFRMNLLFHYSCPA